MAEVHSLERLPRYASGEVLGNTVAQEGGKKRTNRQSRSVHALMVGGKGTSSRQSSRRDEEREEDVGAIEKKNQEFVSFSMKIISDFIFKKLKLDAFLCATYPTSFLDSRDKNRK